MENKYQPSGELFEFGFDEQSKDILKSIGKWARITAIVAFISYGLSLIVQFMTPGLPGSSGDSILQATRVSSIVTTVVATIIGVVINVFLLRFATEIVEGVNTVSQPKVESAFGNLKTYFQILGIIIIIALVIVVFALLIGVIAGASRL